MFFDYLFNIAVDIKSTDNVAIDKLNENIVLQNTDNLHSMLPDANTLDMELDEIQLFLLHEAQNAINRFFYIISDSGKQNDIYWKSSNDKYSAIDDAIKKRNDNIHISNSVDDFLPQLLQTQDEYALV